MKLKIDNELLAEEFFENTHLLGIVAPVKGYQFVWHLNQLLGLNFRLNSGLEIELRKKLEIIFSKFTSIKFQEVVCFIISITISIMANTCCRNLNIWIFYG